MFSFCMAPLSGDARPIAQGSGAARLMPVHHNCQHSTNFQPKQHNGHLKQALIGCFCLPCPFAITLHHLTLNSFRKCAWATMCSLVMSLFSHDYIKMEMKYQQCLTYLYTCVQYLHSAWFLYGRTSILVSCYSCVIQKQQN